MTQWMTETQETAEKSASTLPLGGVSACTVHFAPFSVSMNACPLVGFGLDAIATTQCRVAAQETLVAKIVPPGRPGSLRAVHAVPFQASATGNVAEAPLT